jgi:hypothetical protein
VTDVPQGYLPPLSAYQPLAPEGFDPNDSLVNPPDAGINGWFNRVAGLFRRSWKSMVVIFTITYVIPSIVLAIIFTGATFFLIAGIVNGLPNRDGAPLKSDVDINGIAIGIPVLIAVVLVVIVLAILTEMAGYAAATYAVTRQATGQRVGLGEALGYGFRRCLGLTGWQFVAGLLAVAGFVACIIPGLYVYAATALFGPIYLFERRRPIGRSFAIFNNNFGRVLGRLALILCAMVAASVLNSIVANLGTLATGNLGNTDLELSALVASQAVSSLFGIVIELPLTMITFAGILLTYSEQRGHEGPVNAATLAAEL